MDFLEYKGYKGSVEYSKEGNCLFGKVQGLSKELTMTYDIFLCFRCSKIWKYGNKFVSLQTERKHIPPAEMKE
jgi:hypothetical protein